MTSSMPNVNKRVRSRLRFSLPCRTSFLLCLACIAVAGCGQRGVQPRFQVQGTVTFKGRPVPSGTIRFEPDGSRGNQGPVSVIPIREGHYRSDQPGVKGSIKGPLAVWISGYPARDPNVEIQPPLFPEYRTTVDMVPQGTTTTLDFEVSDPTTSK